MFLHLILNGLKKNQQALFINGKKTIEEKLWMLMNKDGAIAKDLEAIILIIILIYVII